MILITHLQQHIFFPRPRNSQMMIWLYPLMEAWTYYHHLKTPRHIFVLECIENRWRYFSSEQRYLYEYEHINNSWHPKPKYTLKIRTEFLLKFPVSICGFGLVSEFGLIIQPWSQTVNHVNRQSICNFHRSCFASGFTIMFKFNFDWGFDAEFQICDSQK